MPEQHEPGPREPGPREPGPHEPGRPAARPLALAPVAALAGATTGLLVTMAHRYGLHRDELYFLAAAERPAWGYVDQPPLTPMLARTVVELLGDSPTAVRLPSALIAGAVVALTGVLARELGGGRAAQVLAAGAAAASAFVLGVGHLLSTSTVDLLAWVVLSVLLVRALRPGGDRWWLAVGAVAGVALLNKHLVLLLALALAVALLAVGPRRVWRSPWLWAGVGLAALLWSPNLAWQAANGWPQVVMAGAISGRDGVVNRLLFLPLQLVYVSPLLVPLWLAGLVRLWRDRELRVLAVTFVVASALTLLSGGQPYYAAGLYPLLLAAGAEPATRWARRGPVVAVAAALSAVVVLPVLPERAAHPVVAVHYDAGEQIGWPELAATVAGVWRQVPADARPSATVVTTNYGQAGAIERYGSELGLPAPYSRHNSYWDWGPPPDSADGPVVVVSGVPGDELAEWFRGCRVAARVDNGLGVANDEQGTPVRLCEGTTAAWSQLWPAMRSVG